MVNLTQVGKKLAIVMLITLSASCNQTTTDKEEKVAKIAEETTVKVTGRGRVGSGVIIDKEGNTYYVLTSRHVVGTNPGSLEEPYKIITHDGMEHEPKIRKSGNLDLALLTFKSATKYNFVSEGNKPSPQEVVYISGWRDCGESTPYEFNQGEISTILSSPKDLPKENEKFYDKKLDYEEGYRVKYTNKTIDGMSGSPVFDETGKVVAIHGQPGKDRRNQYDFKACPPLNESYSDGGNWGIPISQYSQSDF